MTRQTDNAAKAIRSLLGRGLDQRQQLGEYGTVKRVNPLEIELMHTDDVIDSDELVVTQAVRQYDRDVGLKAGDSVTLMQMENGEVVAIGVISDSPLHDGEVTKDYVQAALLDTIPSGVIWPSGRSSLPSGWLACDGAAVSRTAYARLFGAVGTQFGVGDGSTTFNVPDFRGRAPVGTGTGDAADATAHTMGQKAGTETHVLTIAQLATHNHGSGGGSGTAASITGITIASATDTYSGTSSAPSVASTGAGTAHSHAASVGQLFTAGTTPANPTDRLMAGNSGGTTAGVAIATGIIASEAAHTHSMQSHTHTYSGTTAGHAHGYTEPNGGVGHAHVLTAQGSGDAHPNMQPYLGVAFMIKV